MPLHPEVGLRGPKIDDAPSICNFSISRCGVCHLGQRMGLRDTGYPGDGMFCKQRKIMFQSRAATGFSKPAYA